MPEQRLDSSGWRRRRLPPRLAGLALIAVVLPDCGGSKVTAPLTTTTSVPPAPTPPPTPTKLSDLSASVTSPQNEASINCSDDVRARVTLVNNGGTDVAVRGVLLRSGTTAGACFGDFEFTYLPRSPVAAGRTSTVVFDQSLFSNGSACCDGRGCAGSCRFQEGFEVVTDVGSVAAGAINYHVFFQNCRSCATATSAASGRPPCARLTGFRRAQAAPARRQ